MSATENRKPRILHIDSSILGAGSASRQLSQALVEALRGALPDAEHVRRDLELDPLPHLDGKMLAAAWPENKVDSATAREVARNTAVLEEFLAADVVVIGAPMYNFGVPTQLKAWIDRIAVAGRTFKYTENGPVGLATDKKVLVAVTRGGVYEAGTPMAAFDFQESYLRAVFRFLGVRDLEFVRAEGLAISPERREEATKAALARIPGVVRDVATSVTLEAVQRAA